MSYQEISEPLNQEVAERYPLVMERLGQICGEETVAEPYRGYFRQAAAVMLKMHNAGTQIREGRFFTRSQEELARWNTSFYEEVMPEAYENSYANPACAVRMLGEEYGKLLCMVYDKIRGLVRQVMEGDTYLLTIYGELLVEIYNCFEEQEGTSPEEIGKIIYWFFHDYSEIFVENSVERQTNPEMDYITSIIMESDLGDLRYLYRYGARIGENELGTASYLKELPQEQIQAMADTYTEGYRIGFEVTRKDLFKKNLVEMIYPIGFERVVRAAIGNFARLGLRPVFRLGNGELGAYVTPFNEQYVFDHKNDAAAYLDKAYVERRLECLRTSYEARKDAARGYGGPAVIEVFGRPPFAPESKAENYQYDEKQQKLNVYYSNQASQITNQYIIGEERSFTIIAYPVPEIGPGYREIFARTVELNNLDYHLYQQMQQRIIDLLDQAEYVHIRGRGDNRTDLKVAIRPLADPEKETAFENCVADVNIPVGEVFTSPKLAGTEGVLHVTQVYLHQLKYVDLELTFQDGMIVSYKCKNFQEEAENQKFLKENLLHHHETLPMGEFAIGTNTTAYRMARDFDIADKLPILIAEKTGPHFAVGDTCYIWAEDTAVYNPDGKEIVARDNAVSLLRKEDPQKAYFNCHTDITIPYDELDTITVVRPDGSRQDIIAGGRFVAPGTEALNVPLDKE